MRDRHILYAAAFVRALATGLMGVLLGIYLARLDRTPTEIGVIVGAGLAGGAVGALVATIWGDRAGRRTLLMLFTLAAAAGGLGLALSSSPFTLGLAAFVGMANGMGRDRGAALVLEQAILPATVSDRERTQAFAWYNVVQDVGHALGGLLAGVPALLQAAAVSGAETSLRVTMGGYGVLVLLPAVLYLALSAAAETPREARRRPVSPDTRRVLWRISGLFSVDSLAGGFLTTALLAFFFVERFGVGVGTVAWLFFAARVANALSHFAAAWLARRIGLVNTMVFTHIPSSLLLMTVPFAPSFPVAAALFILREGLVEMDVPTRQSYVMAVVRPEERTVASGVTHLVRVAAWAVAPFVAGPLMETGSLGLPLLIGAGMKIGYDVMLYVSFSHLKPPEERAAG